MPESGSQFYVFADDCQAYGPASVTLLQEWAGQGLLSPQSWIFDKKLNRWNRASQIQPLTGFLTHPTPPSEIIKRPLDLRGGQLRRIRLFSDMTDEQAEKFVNLLEKIKVRAFQPIVRQGEFGDSMFLLLEGEARVSLKMKGKEEMLTMLKAGDFFGEITLLDDGPRSADVTANNDCTLLKLSKKNLERLCDRHPDLAAMFLTAMNRYLCGRLRQTNDRFAKAQLFSWGASGQINAPSDMKLRK